MLRTIDNERQFFDAETFAILDKQFAASARRVNVVRIAVLSMLALAAALYAPHLTPALTTANLVILAPMLAWAIGQTFVAHRDGIVAPTLSMANIVFDISATSILLLAYGVFGDPNLAVKSPIFSLYFIILATRPFTGSARLAAIATCLAASEYAVVVVCLISFQHLPLLATPMIAASGNGTSLLDELSRVALLLIAGSVLTYATAWIERTLHKGIAARRSADARFRAVFEQSGVGVALIDEALHIVQANEALGELLGLEPERLAGRSIHEFSLRDDAETMERLVRDVHSGVRERASAELRYLSGAGEVVWGSFTVSRAEGAGTVDLIVVVQDVTQRKSLEGELLQQAFYDQLTGLANRTLFRDRVGQALARSQRERDHVAVMFLDLDNFKSINDTLGHAAGDNLLSIAAARLLNATRGCDTVARLGGDEFAVLLENVRGEEDATIVADRIVHALSSPIELDSGITVRVGASIGIARAAVADQVEEILRNADVAMYAAKGSSRGRYLFFDPAMHAALVDRVAMETDLRLALERGEFWLAYQPIVALESHEVLGLEALVRWAHPTKGTILPAHFIPLAEETGLILDLGRWVLGEACTRTAEWNARRVDGRCFSISVNLSSRQLQAGALLSDVADALANAGLAASLLVLEITESALMQHTELTLGRLRELKALGVRLAIDDFGTGYSSLSYLQQFPVDILKIDRSFTEQLLRGGNNDALARTIISLGDLLSLRTIAAGVESAQQYARLRDLGCDYGQGYLFSRPLARHDMERLLTMGTLQITGEQPIVLSGVAGRQVLSTPQA